MDWPAACYNVGPCAPRGLAEWVACIALIKLHNGWVWELGMICKGPKGRRANSGAHPATYITRLGGCATVKISQRFWFGSIRGLLQWEPVRTSWAARAARWYTTINCTIGWFWEPGMLGKGPKGRCANSGVQLGSSSGTRLKRSATVKISERFWFGLIQGLLQWEPVRTSWDNRTGRLYSTD